ncbi:MAG: hypothetical protein ACI8PT_000730 [Gammaproteobacteria bacterium]|jgi:hypothetical protein
MGPWDAQPAIRIAATHTLTSANELRALCTDALALRIRFNLSYSLVTSRRQSPLGRAKSLTTSRVGSQIGPQKFASVDVLFMPDALRSN